MMYWFTEWVQGAVDILKKRKDEGHHSIGIGKYFDGQWDDIQGIFQISRDVFSFILD